jgi:hypothetical protein
MMRSCAQQVIASTGAASRRRPAGTAQARDWRRPGQRPERVADDERQRRDGRYESDAAGALAERRVGVLGDAGQSRPTGVNRHPGPGMRLVPWISVV